MQVILDTITGLLTGEGFVPQGQAYSWQPDILWLHALSDGITGLSYFLIPVAIFFILRRRSDFQFSESTFWIFIAFIVSCGITHFIDIYTIWHPAYRLSGGMKAINAALSIITAVAIWPLIPKFAKASSTASLQKANAELQKQIDERVRVEQELQLHKDNLETLVQNRTQDLEETLLQLKHEIRDRQRAQGQVNFQASLLDQLDSAIMATDTHQRIVYWNKHAERLFGWQKEEALGRRTADLLFPKKDQQKGDRYHKILASKRWEGESNMLHRSGRIIPIHTNATHLTDEQGKNIGYALVCFDMTDHVKLERKLRKDKETAERAALAKQDFLSTMSHEIRTPLNVVVGMTRLLIDGNPKEEQLEYLKSLQFSANHLLVIINDILDFAKIEAGRIKLEKIGFSPKEVAEGITKAFTFRANEKNINLRIEWDDAIPERIVGDEVRLTQILNNLVGNAIKFTEQGFVSIHAKLLNKKDKKYEIRFEVRDTGIGIAKDRLQTIFQRYTQAESDTTRKFGGTGLGLTICKRLVELQGGLLQVRSKEGLGSTFSFTLLYDLDTKTPDKKVQPKKRLDTEKLKGINLLLVEDNPSNRMVATSFLHKVGVEVDTAEHGKIAVSAVQEKEYDIILMDLQMPVMDGCEATKAIRALGGNFEHKPIIALTADVVQGVKDRVFKCGMNDYLSKPFNPDELHYKIALNLNLIEPDETQEISDNSDDIVTLYQLIDKYNDDVKFVTNLLDSLRKSFQLLTEQVIDSADQKNLHELRRLTHKLLPSIKMVENHSLQEQLTGLKKALDKESTDESEVNQYVEAIRESSNKSIEYIDDLFTNIKKHKDQLTASNQ
uniref:histidine kinase n=1 Tax=Roseihalotalea indica TaxID=2867963 RepID=A0AA49JKF0_9BACT|nr:ATP-binding protein [Tunicatimonas sp. TK19036]